MPSLAPTMCVDSLASVSFSSTAAAAGRKINLMSLDGDRVLVPHGGWYVPEENLLAVERMAEEYRSPDYGGESDIMFILNSNAGSLRERRRIEFVAEQVAEASNSLVPAVTSDETGHLKPHRAQYEKGRERSGVPLNETAHVDDQWAKGVIGAILAGCAAGVLASPYGPGGHEHPGTQVQRLVEAGLRPFFGLPFRTADFGDETLRSERYHRAERLSAGLALGLTVEGVKLARTDKRLGGAALIVAGAGVANHALSMHKKRESSRVEEGLQAIIDRYGGGEPPADGEV